WAVFGHGEELFRFFVGEHSSDDVTFVVDSFMYYLDDSTLPESTKRSLYRALIDTLPVCSHGVWSEVLSAIPDDPDLWLHAACVAGSTTGEVEADLGFYVHILQRALTFVSVECKVEDDDTLELIRGLLRHIHARCHNAD
ncbi:MAG: hypothetical protein K8E66_09960, partial [Phycisphaerales bacterium]|nr:hypothetical protein [Phycisphaerales bacterium]